MHGLDNSPNPLAYLGRWPGEDHDEAAGRPRYKWPPGFPKHRVLYGLRKALQTPEGQPLIVVEGPFGLYHLVQAGFAATVAVCGSDLSDEQTALLVESNRPLVLLFDGDEAGRKGLCEAAAKLIPHRFVRVVRLPDGIQPDNVSADDLRSLLSSG